MEEKGCSSATKYGKSIPDLQDYSVMNEPYGFSDSPYLNLMTDAKDR